MLAVMHRLKHVTRHDKVAFRDGGLTAECAAPAVLLAEDACFAQFCKSSAHAKRGREDRETFEEGIHPSFWINEWHYGYGFLGSPARLAVLCSGGPVRPDNANQQASRPT